jgi:hypothetical protein
MSLELLFSCRATRRRALRATKRTAYLLESQADPSSGTSVTRDAVGVPGAREIFSTNALGRIWGSNFHGNDEQWREMACRPLPNWASLNNSTGQPLIDTATSKYAMSVCGETIKLAHWLLISVRPYGYVMEAVSHINPRCVGMKYLQARIL